MHAVAEAAVGAADGFLVGDFSECARSPRSRLAIRRGVWLLRKNDVELPGFRNSRNVKVCKVCAAGDGQVGEVAEP